MCTKEIDKVGARRLAGRVGIGGRVRAADWAEIGERVRAEDGWPCWHRWIGARGGLGGDW